MGKVVAKLIIEDRVERELSYVEMDYRRGTRWYGMPCTPPMGGLITVVFTSQRNDDYFLDWMFANRFGDKSVASIHQFYTIKKGAVVFYEDDYDGVILDRYRFEDCTPIYYREVFSNLHGMVVIMTLSAAIQKYKFQLFVKQWHESWRPPEEYKPQPLEDFAPKVTDCYYTDLDGNEQAEPVTGKEVYVVVETENATGRNIEIDLSDHERDFEYEGKLLKDDLLKVHIHKRKERIKLKVVRPQNKNITT